MKAFVIVAAILFALAYILILVAGYHLGKLRARWCKCAWHASEFWYSNAGHTSTCRPWHIDPKEISHGCCQECGKRELARVLENQTSLDHDCFNAPSMAGRVTPCAPTDFLNHGQE